MRCFLLISLAFVLSNPTLQAQINPVTTAVPGLLINENVQTGGMGEIGTVATEYNYNAAYFQNPALLARNNKIIAGYINYTPWLRSLVPDINIVNLGFVYSPDGKNGFSGAMNYFSLSEVTYTTPTGAPWGVYRPVEIYSSVRYARAFSNNFSLGLGYKNIYSKLGPDFIGNNSNEGMSHAGDIGVDYRSTIHLKENKDLRLNIGSTALNIGQKISYTPGRYDFIPSVLKVAAMASFNSHYENNDLLTISFSYQAQKLLVPSSPIRNQQYRVIAGRDNNISVVEGILGSFSDAPGTPVRDANGDYIYQPDGMLQIESGSVMKEELNEIIHQFGMETRYLFSNSGLALAYRLGYFHEHENKGNRKFITTGIGVQRKAYGLDLAYYIPVVARHRMGNTIIFALSYQLFR
ncbi:MAG: PorV/PorQ family protein [Bacteroidota bacterium]|nr:PorV/PorQ family protein [Bacteroidota bacterium]